MAPVLGKWVPRAAIRHHSVKSESYFIPQRVIHSEEPLDRYEPGGYHPVNIGDTLDGGRYTVMLKLGWGQYSTVWLAVDGM
jgi:serine/threonine-protein kinase SRPK3